MKTKLNKNEAVDKNGKIWNKESIQLLIDKNDKAVYHAMLRIYARQTRDEQENAETRDYNTVGFTGVDGYIMSKYVEGYKKYGRLTEKQMVVARKKMKKYWRQLLDDMKHENPQVLSN
jgi:hypothetical protein